MSELEPGVWHVKTDQSLLDPNGRLNVCIAQPQCPTLQQVLEDSPRPLALALARAVFAAEEGLARVSKWWDSRPGLLLFPEYTFGSGDFAELQSLIEGYPGAIVVVAPFGASTGAALKALIANGCSPSWPHGAAAVENESRYNAAWCWVKESSGANSCTLFLKNYLEQAHERINVPAIKEGTHVLAIETSDVVLFPVICADLISKSVNSPTRRIGRAVSKLPNRPVLVAAGVMSKFHSLWRAALDALFNQVEGRPLVLMTANQVGGLSDDAELDRWRSFSGGICSRGAMPKPPEHPPLPVKYVSTDTVAGFVLRTCSSIAN